MGAFKEEAKGVAQQVKGTAKETAGKAIGNPGLQVKGNIEKNVGKVRQAAARRMEALKGSVQESQGKIRRKANE
jgi:uncharacterized protein YjbJ (UPF0337 family)